jgi:hypothetical protein
MISAFMGHRGFLWMPLVLVYVWMAGIFAMTARQTAARNRREERAWLEDDERNP